MKDRIRNLLVRFGEFAFSVFAIGVLMGACVIAPFTDIEWSGDDDSPYFL